MKKLSLIFFSLFLACLAFPAQAALLQPDKSGDFMNNVNSIARQTEYSTTTTLEGTIGSIIRIAMSLLGSVFIILIIIAGINWMRAQGNEEIVKKSKTTIINLVVGLIIVIAAFTLSTFIGNIFSSLLVTQP